MISFLVFVSLLVLLPHLQLFSDVCLNKQQQTTHQNFRQKAYLLLTKIMK